MAGLNEAIHGTITDSMRDLESGADRIESTLTGSIHSAIGQSMADLESGASRIETVLNDKLANVTANISADVEQTAMRMDAVVRKAMEELKVATVHIEDLVEVRAVHTADELGRKASEINRIVSEHTDRFAELIDTKQNQLTNALGSQTNLLRAALEANARDAEDIMSESSNRIQHEITDSLRKLNDANLLLQRVLEASTGNLARLQGNVGEQTQAYTAAVRDAMTGTEQAGTMMSQHVEALQNTMSAMLEQFGQLSGKLNSETDGFTTAAANLAEVSNSTMDTLENRRGAMESLAEGFAARTDEIDNRLRGFAQSIAETVNQTERRLIAARKAMEDALASTSDAVTGQISTIGDLASGEGQRASDALRQTQADLLADIERAYADATRRFGDTADAMRMTASQLGQELEATRNELQRSVLDLPEETRASAAAMRRVVAEQIEALSELNAIVRAQPGTHEVSNRTTPRTPSARLAAAEPTRRAEPAPQPVRQPEVRQPEVRQPEPTRQQAPVATQARPAETQKSPSERLNEALTQSRSNQPQPAPAAAPAAPQEGGWLRDVLRNASASQQAGTQRPLNLSSLTEDIARAIDSDALTAAWNRYQDGESGAFNRRLYTITGQSTFDEVRRKLQRDPEFSRTASAYMNEFEQLLGEAANGPNGMQQTFNQLVSNRGKVYTMLAHASGRLN